MEFEDVSEKMEWKARRVAAAFQVNNPTIGPWHEFTPKIIRVLDARDRGYEMMVWFYEDHTYFCFDEGKELSIIVKEGVVTTIFDERTVKEEQEGVPIVPLAPIGRGFYKLGYDYSLLEERFRVQLLSAHEKLELRLSMPREFWPQKWLEEEAK
jgi:hypothetical protein